ncbi:MAG: SPOR domain-containing protein [Alphaproteobacteria bacterium]|nr:SPOR domain-containing protein [Alphaproteobacteria bacterium]
MHIRRPPSGDGPRIYRPNESVAVRLEPPARPVAYEPESIPPPPRDSLLARVNRRRSQILTLMVSTAAIASFGSVVWWAHNQDVRAGGKGLEPLVIQAPDTPSRVKPENAGGYVPPDQDKEVYNRIAPNAVPVQPEKLLPGPTTPQLPANGQVPLSTKPINGDGKGGPASTTSTTPATGINPAPASGSTPPPAASTPPLPANQPTVTQAPTTTPTETGPSIASLIENMSGPTGGWRIQIASVKTEDIAKSTWARLQAAHGDVLANLRMQPTRVDLGDKGVWYRVQAGPLDEKQAQSVCSSLRSRRTDCVVIPPAR